MRSSILSAFYTPDHVVRAIGAALADSGIVPQRMLDPSAGIGIFPDHLGKPDGTTDTVCVEQDALTAKVLSALYPEYRIINDGFQSVGDSLDGRFDVVASNIPFGNFRIFDMGFDRSKDPVRNSAQNQIHNYFFLKGVDALHEGGVLAFITTRGVMDKPGNKSIREWLVNNCDLLSAVRLPDDIFKENAGTEAGTDIIVLQKRSGKTTLAPHEEAFINTKYFDNLGITINSTFDNGRNTVSTSMRAGKDQYGQPAFEFRFSGTPEEMGARLTAMLSGDMRAHFDRDLYLTHSGGQGQTPPAAPAMVTVPESAVIDTVAEEIERNEEPRPWYQLEGEPHPSDLNPLSQAEELDPFWQAIEDDWSNPNKQPEKSITPEQEAASEDTPFETPEIKSYQYYPSVSEWRVPGYLNHVAEQARKREQPALPQDNAPAPMPSQTQAGTPTPQATRAAPIRNLNRRGKPTNTRQQTAPDT